MKAMLQHKFGGPEVIELGELPDPKASAPGDVVVRVRAVSVNPLDTKMRSGKIPAFIQGRKFPKVLGADFSGEVVEVAKGGRFKPGDEVCGGVRIMGGNRGANAELVLAPETSLAAKPKQVSHRDACTLAVGGLTSWQAVTTFGRLREGKRLLVHGATGGVGSFALQLGKLKGAHVTAVCSAKNVELARSLGADDVIDYGTQDFRAGAAASYDVVFDVVGTSTFASCRRILKPDGVFITSLPSPAAIAGKLRALFTSQEMQMSSAADVISELPKLVALLADGKLKVNIDKTFTLEQMPDAHRALEAGARGKVVVDVP